MNRNAKNKGGGGQADRQHTLKEGWHTHEPRESWIVVQKGERGLK